LIDLVAVGVAKRHLPLQHIPPVPALAAPVRQPGKERGRVRVLTERCELDRGAIDLLAPALQHTDVLDMAGRFSRDFRHRLDSFLDNWYRHREDADATP